MSFSCVSESEVALQAVPWPADTWTFYTALSLFRYGAICAGVYLRMLQVGEKSFILYWHVSCF
jgi:hypothetical protein